MDDRPNGERWSRVEALYHDAVEMPVSERAAFLREACGDDNAVREEVKALLAVADDAKEFLEPVKASGDKDAGAGHHLWIGQAVGPYQVTALIGAGGMGEVYRATDTRLGRNVALKVLHDAFNTDADRLRRFEQESRATAALNHPNILAVFDVGSHHGAPYYVVELLEGQTLRDGLRRGRPPVHEAIDYAIQMATGLAAAHDRGIIHRDLKPENVFITTDGRVKILDFGVAKLVDATPPNQRPIGAAPHGTLVGTVGYMSPEQLHGGPVDARTDIFSVGAVLHEMITGHRAFERETAAASLPSSSAEAASALGIARRCLEPDAASRFTSCRELISALSGAKAGKRLLPRTARLRAAAASLFVLLLASAAMAAWLRGRTERSANVTQIGSVAVLPLVSLSRQADDDIFANGMTGALITNLAKIRALRVVSRTSVMRYKHTQKSVPEIGRELNVDAVIEGSIERVGNRVRISAQLIRTATDEHLWAEAYDREARDVLLLQNEVAQSVARAVRVTLTPEERAGFARARAVDPTAYELYLKARQAWNERTEGSIHRAIAYLTQAIERDPGYAPAYSGLADCYLSLGFSFDVGSMPPRDAIPKAKAAALKALALDDSLSEAHTSLAYAKLTYDWDWPGAEAEFKRALALNPSSAEGHHWYSHLLVSSGRFDESLASSDRALALDQHNPILSVHLGWHQFFARQYDNAVTQLGQTIDREPNYGLAYWYRGLAYEQQRRFSDAVSEMRKGAALLTGNVVVLADIGHVHAVAGEKREAERVIAALQEESRRRYVSPFEIALIYVGLGDRARAFEWLERAYEERSDLLVYLKVDPRLDPIRSDGRFKDLVTRVGVPANR